MSDPFQSSCVLIYGAPKSGKTTLAASFPSPVQWFATEPGHKFLPPDQRKKMIRLSFDSVKVGKQEFFNGWDLLMFVLREKLIVKRKPKTVVVDTVGNLYAMCFDAVCNAQKVEHPEDMPHGKGWALIKREFIRGIDIIASQAEKVKANVVLIAHATQREIRAGARTYDRILVDLPGQARGVVMPAPDAIWYLGFKAHAESEGDDMSAFHQNRCLWMQPTPVIEAGSRDPSHNVQQIFPLNKTNQYEQIVKEISKHNGKA